MPPFVVVVLMMHKGVSCIEARLKVVFLITIILWLVPTVVMSVMLFILIGYKAMQVYCYPFKLVWYGKGQLDMGILVQYLK